MLVWGCSLIFATHWWFFYLETSPAGMLCSASPAGTLYSPMTLIPELHWASSVQLSFPMEPLLDLCNHRFDVATFCYSFNWDTAVVCAGSCQWPHLIELFYPSATAFTFVHSKKLTHSNKQTGRQTDKNPKVSLSKDSILTTQNSRWVNTESGSERAAWWVTSTTEHYTRGKLEVDW